MKTNTFIPYARTGEGLAVYNNDSRFLDVLYSGSLSEGDLDYDSLSMMYKGMHPEHAEKDLVLVSFGVFDGSIRKEQVLKVISAAVIYQQKFLSTGDCHKCRRMTLGDLEKATDIDISVISRALDGAVAYTSRGMFTLHNSEASLATPSLFDEGARKNGRDISRQEVLFELNKVIEGEDKTAPFTDEKLKEIMVGQGYEVARRTVVKYRGLLDCPNSRERRMAA